MKKVKRNILIITTICILFICNFLSDKMVTTINGSDLTAMCENKIFVIGGESVGIKLLSSGVLVMKTEREDIDLKVGDVILKVNEREINTSYSLQEFTRKSNGEELELKVSRNGNERNIKVKPILDNLSNEYKLNIWVKDSTAGVGTITFYEKNNMLFAGLGHGVTETDENYIIPLEAGAITFTEIYNIKKGYANDPGEVRGTVTSKVYGSILSNTQRGIYGKITDKELLENKEEILILSKEQIKEGKAYIYTSVNYGEKKYYEIEIQKIMLNSDGNKNMLIKIVDKELLSLTGGIIQGMSGSPIIQDEKLIGAVTHVLLNDPTTGYGVFIENMIEDMIKIE